MLEYDFENSPGFWIMAAAHELSRAFNDQLQQHGITRRQWEVLGLISCLGEISQSEVADRLGIEAPTLVGVLDRMERDGWIERVPNPEDRRKKLIRPTDRVEPVWAQMVDCGLRVRRQAAQGLERDQLDQLREILGVIRKNLTTDRSAEERFAATRG